MKAISFTAPEKVEIVVKDDPKPSYGEVVVRVKSSSLCAADLDPYHGKAHVGVGEKGHGSVIPGHEACGVVEKIGPGVDFPNVGERVAVYTFVSCNNCSECFSGYWMLCKEARCLGFDLDGADAELLLVPARNCLEIPNWMDFDTGSLTTDLLGTTYSAAKRIDVNAEDSVAVFGLGPIGICQVLVCKALGAQVVGIDTVRERLEIGKSLGCDEVLDSTQVSDVKGEINKLLGGLPTKSIDCSGNARAESESLRCVGNHGKVALVGWGLKAEIEPAGQVITKDLTIRGSWYFNVGDYQKMINLVRSKKLPLEKTITHRFKLDQSAEAFLLFDSKKTLKTVLNP